MVEKDKGGVEVCDGIDLRSKWRLNIVTDCLASTSWYHADRQRKAVALFTRSNLRSTYFTVQRGRHAQYEIV